MRPQKHKFHETIRLTIDFPAEQHAYLKMLAAQRGISMKQYVIESLSRNVESEEVKHVNLSKNKFKKLLPKIIEENKSSLRRLADK